jgi:hypothetical protein
VQEKHQLGSPVIEIDPAKPLKAIRHWPRHSVHSSTSRHNAMTKYLYILCDSGLANRMHAILGAKRLAELTGRQLRIYWPVNQFCGARFKHLFQYTQGGITEDMFVKSDAIVDLLSTRNRVKVYNCGLDETSVMEREQVRRDDPEDILVIKSWYAPKFWDEGFTPVKEYMRRYMAATFVPHPELLDHASTPAFRVGMHIRYGDKKPAEGQTIAWEDYTVQLFGISSPSRFVDAYVELTCHFRACGLPLAIFVASTNGSIEKMFSERGDRYLVRVTCQEKPQHNTWTVAGMKASVRDLFSLAQCHVVLGSYYSQFSQAAGELYGSPVIEVGTQGWMEKMAAVLPSKQIFNEKA